MHMYHLLLRNQRGIFLSSKIHIVPLLHPEEKKANRSTNKNHRKKENISSRHSIQTTRILFRYNPILDTMLIQDHDFQTKLTSIHISMNWHPWFPNNRNTLHRSIHISMNWHPLRRGKQLTTVGITQAYTLINGSDLNANNQIAS